MEKIVPVVTIGMCVKNCEDSISSTVRSVISQSFPPHLMELIVVDGYSEDRTEQIINEILSKSDIKYKLFYENEGLGTARQIVVDNAIGDYIIWVDGDIILSKDYVNKLVRFMEKNPKVGIAKGKYTLNSEGNVVAILENMGRKLKYTDLRYEGEAYKLKAMATEGCIYRVEAIRQVGGFDKKIKSAGEDWDAEYRIRNAGWKLYITNAFFSNQQNKMTWKDLWRKYYHFGHSLHYVVHKQQGLERVCEMTPPVQFFSGLLYSFKVYKSTRQKMAFLLPFQFMLKMTAWCLGFVESHFKEKYVA